MTKKRAASKWMLLFFVLFTTITYYHKPCGKINWWQIEGYSFFMFIFAEISIRYERLSTLTRVYRGH